MELTPERLPIYPFFIALIFKIFGSNNLIALLLTQSFLGFLTFFYLIKTLEKLKLGNNLIILLTLLFNLSIIFRFTVFYQIAYLFFLLHYLYIILLASFYLRKKNFFFLYFF